MFVFVKRANDIMDSLSDVQGADQHDDNPIGPQPSFDDFKVFAAQYALEHDELPRNHPTLGQIMNSPTVDDIEIILRGNHDYCDDCLIKLYRKYAGGKESEACPCGGE